MLLQHRLSLRCSNGGTGCGYFFVGGGGAEKAGELQSIIKTLNVTKSSGDRAERRELEH